MASTRERNGRYTGLYRTQDGQQKSAGTFATKAAALKAAKAHEAVESNGQDAKAVLAKPVKVYRQEKGGKLTVAGYFPVFMTGHKLEATSRESYECMGKHIIKGLGNVTLAELDAPKVRTFIRSIEGTMSGSTVGHVMTVLREMCKTAVQDKLMTSDPTTGIKISGRKAPEMKIITTDEYKRLLVAIPAHYQLLIMTLVSTGLRWGECLGIKASDIEPKGNGYVIHIRRNVRQVGGKCEIVSYGKTANALRDVTITSELGQSLIERAGKDGFVFRSPRGCDITRANFRHVWIKALAAAGIENLRVHDLRHTHASWIVNSGCDLVTARDRLGHSDIRVTSRYLHAVDNGEDRALAALERAMAA
jgi:integrase